MSPETYKKMQEIGYTGAIDDSQAFKDWSNNLDEYNRSYVMDTLNGRVPAWWKFYQEAMTYKDANPYIYQQMMSSIDNYRSQKFEPDFWQQMGEDFGYYTARTNFDNQRIANLTSAFEKIRESLHTEEYTDPTAQVQRERAAGLNPDLSGGSNISSGEPGNIDQAEISPAAFNDGTNPVKDIGNVLLNLIQTGFSVASSVQGLQSGAINIANQQLSQRKDMINLFTDEITRNFTPEQVKILLTGDSSSEDYKSLLVDLQSVFSGVLADSSIPASIRRKFRGLKTLDGQKLSNLKNQKELYSFMQDYANNRLGAIQGLAHPFNSQDFAECIRLFGEFYNHYEIEYEKLIKNFDFEKYNVTDSEGYTQGSLAGAANVAGLSFEAFQKQNDELVERMWNNIYKKLEDKHSDFADILIMLIPMFRSMMMSARVPSLNLGASWNGGTKTNVYRRE